MQVWEAWQQAALVDFSPNLAPVISKARELQRQTSPLAYHNLVALADGNQSFRDLAVKLRQNLVPLTQSLMPYIRKGLIEVVEVADVNYSSNSVTPPKSQPAQAQTSAIPVQPQPSTPLVVYIDDSPNDSRTMSYILSQAGYRFINVQDPVKALPTLLEHKPDLIFLDLVMPVANGYEICAQIRRISAFKDTPVIILTSNDGIVDRVRAKMVGSSGFLTKPIESDKVLKTLQRHLVVGQGEIDRFKSSQFSMD
jgi:CheY-like chemotaxis protein